MDNKSKATWKGNLKEGKGDFTVGNEVLSGVYSFQSRFEKDHDTSATNPEELLAAAHSACYSMALSLEIEKAGGNPDHVHTEAVANLEKDGEGFAIKKITLNTTIKAAGLDKDRLQELAEAAKEGCPVSKLFKGATIELKTNFE